MIQSQPAPLYAIPPFLADSLSPDPSPLPAAIFGYIGGDL